MRLEKPVFENIPLLRRNFYSVSRGARAPYRDMDFDFDSEIPDFEGSRGCIEANIDLLRKPRKIRTGAIGLDFPSGTQYLNAHFDIGDSNIFDGELEEVIDKLVYGARDLLELIEELRINPRFNEVELVLGVTNPRFEKLITRFGFEYLDAESRDAKSGEEIAVFATRERLMQSEDFVCAKLSTLESYRSVRATRL